MLLGPQSIQTAGDGQPGLPGAPVSLPSFPLAILTGSHLPAVLFLSLLSNWQALALTTLDVPGYLL